MYCVVNAGANDDRHAWVDLISKGTGNLIKVEETSRYHPSVDMYWQKNAWVDGTIMVQLANKFVKEKKSRHGDEWVVLFADNLSAHLLPQVKEIFGSNQVLCVYFPPNMTEMVQPVDAGYGRSLRSAIGRELDEWLMDAANLLKWEEKMTAMERRVLVTHFIGRSQNYMMLPENDKRRIGCFERPGCLITTRVCDKDHLIRPQGVTVPYLVPTLPPLTTEVIEELDQEPQAQQDTQEMKNMTQLFNDIDLEDEELLLNDEIVIYEVEI